MIYQPRGSILYVFCVKIGVNIYLVRIRFQEKVIHMLYKTFQKVNPKDIWENDLSLFCLFVIISH